MNENTIKYTLSVLDQQRKHYLNRPHDEKQHCYYDGMKTMIDIIISDGHTNGKSVTYDDNGKHYIYEY